MIPEWIREWFWHHFRILALGCGILIAMSLTYYYIQLQFSRRQIRLDSARVERIRDWSPDPPEVVEVFNTDSELLPPGEQAFRPLEVEVSPVRDLGPDVRREEFKMPEIKLQSPPELLGDPVS